MSSIDSNISGSVVDPTDTIDAIQKDISRIKNQISEMSPGNDIEQRTATHLHSKLDKLAHACGILIEAITQLIKDLKKDTKELIDAAEAKIAEVIESNLSKS